MQAHAACADAGRSLLSSLLSEGTRHLEGGAAASPAETQLPAPRGAGWGGTLAHLSLPFQSRAVLPLSPEEVTAL